MAVVGAGTQVVAVIGDPVRHSLSPAIHNAAFHAAGLDWCCVALEVREGDAPDAVSGIRALGLRGASVTMPHKAAVADLLERRSDRAGALRAVNCVVVDPDGELRGENTDGEGFIRGLAEDLSFSPAGRSCGVIGAGGAARAVVRALADAGASEVIVHARSSERGLSAAALAGAVGRGGSETDVAGCELVVNATPVGMAATAGQTPIEPALLGPDHVVVDLIYHPRRTELLARAAGQGASTSNGLSMLVHQAAVAFELWTGAPAPVGAMRAAADSATAQ